MSPKLRLTRHALEADGKGNIMWNVVKAAVAAVALFALSQTSAQAQATRTWVSGVGDDANPCSLTAPCKTFPGAISKTAINGEINCLTPGGFGTVTITKSITIDCHEVFASILASGTNGINVNIAAGNPNDPLRTVRIRNLNINGAGSSGTIGTRTGLKGINILNAAAVFVEDTMIRNFTQQGILDSRTTGGLLYINNTTVQDNTSSAVLIAPSSGSTKIDVTIANSVLERSQDGVRAGNGSRVMVKRSVLSGNTANGAVVESGTGTSRLAIDDSAISNNFRGILQNAGGEVFVSNSDISFNSTGKTGSGGLFSYGNNRLTQNSADGTAFAAVSQQ
jgi:hypothetical protein